MAEMAEEEIKAAKADIAQLDEALHAMRRYRDRLDLDPARLDALAEPAEGGGGDVEVLGDPVDLDVALAEERGGIVRELAGAF